MSEWKTYRLGEIATFKYGKLPPKNSNIGQYPVWSGYRYVGYASTFNCPKNSIIVIARGVGGTGDVKIAKEDCFLTNLSIIVNIDTSICNPYYFYYQYLLSNLKYLDSGSAQSQITIEDLKRLNIKLPSLTLQNRIIEILKSFDDKIELNRRINANLEAQAQALFRSWFVDFEPFRDGPFVDSELGKIPQGWKVGNIYTYMDVIYGAPYKSALFNTDKIGYPLIRIRDLKTYSPQFYTEEILPNTEYVDFGDIVAGMDAEFVPYIWKGEKGLLNQRVCKFIPRYNYVSKYYILSLIRPELEFVQSYKVGTTVSHLGKSDIDKFKVITPPAEIVKRFSCIVDSFHQQIIKLAKENLNLSALRDTLLPKLMAGEINVE